jgi:hypothetical protein
MNKLLVLLGMISIAVAGIFLAQDYGLFIEFIDFLPEIFFNPIILPLTIIILGFIRFNKFMGILCMIVGGIALLSQTGIFGTPIPNFIASWVLVALGIRFLIIGILSEGNIA